MFLFDMAPFGAVGVFVAVAFFFVALASGVFAFIMLRKTLKMAIRMIIVAAILLIAVFGSAALWWFLQPSRPNKPIQNRPTKTQSR